MKKGTVREASSKRGNPLPLVFGKAVVVDEMHREIPELHPFTFTKNKPERIGFFPNTNERNLSARAFFPSDVVPEFASTCDARTEPDCGRILYHCAVEP